MRPRVTLRRRPRARPPEVGTARLPLALLMPALALAACASVDMGVTTSGALPAPQAGPIALVPGDPEMSSDLARALESRAQRGFEAAGFRAAGGAGGAGLEVRLGFSVRPEGLGAHVPVAGEPRWASRPQRRGFLQPRRLVYTVDVWLSDPVTGAEAARARATSRQPRGDAQEILGRLTDMAVGALAGS